MKETLHKSAESGEGSRLPLWGGLSRGAQGTHRALCAHLELLYIGSDPFPLLRSPRLVGGQGWDETAMGSGYRIRPKSLIAAGRSKGTLPPS